MSDSPTPDARNDDGDRTPNGEKLLHDEVRFEDAEVGVFKIVAVLAGIALVFVGVGLVSWWMLNLNTKDARHAAPGSDYSVPTESLPAGPRLEPLDRTSATAAADDFASQLAMENELHGYGTTSEKGFVHIPIERAMKLAIEAMPARKEAAQLPAKSFGLSGGGESNSGRVYSEGPKWLRKE
jgi:hypothetical protein